MNGCDEKKEICGWGVWKLYSLGVGCVHEYDL